MCRTTRMRACGILNVAADRELLSLRYGADLTARQIAELLELKTNAVEVALHRALGRLRSQLEANQGSRSRSPNRPCPQAGQ